MTAQPVDVMPQSGALLTNHLDPDPEQLQSTFRIPHFKHHSVNISTFLNSTFYFPLSVSAIPHFTTFGTLF